MRHKRNTPLIWAGIPSDKAVYSDLSGCTVRQAPGGTEAAILGKIVPQAEKGYIISPGGSQAMRDNRLAELLVTILAVAGWIALAVFVVRYLRTLPLPP